MIVNPPVHASEKLISNQHIRVEQLPRQVVLDSRLRGCYWTTQLFSACNSKILRYRVIGAFVKDFHQPLAERRC